MKAPGEAILEMPWLAPCASSLAALTRHDAASIWAEVRSDPGCVLLLCRAGRERPVEAGSSFSSLTQLPHTLECALALLDQAPTSSVDWASPRTADIHRAALRQARLAQALAQETARCDPDLAWVAGLLAPLGWLAVAAVKDGSVASYWLGGNAAWRAELCGFDHGSLTRRLCRAWQLPQWLSTILGSLGLHTQVAAKLGADPILNSIVALAVALLQKHDAGLEIPVGTSARELHATLGLSSEETSTLVQKVLENPIVPRTWDAPSEQPLLRDLLNLALEQRRRADTSPIERLQKECDHLHRALTEQGAAEQGRLQEMKLKALAELAAGAGHEINNPLAVISGQAQYLLRQLQQAELSLSEATTTVELLEDLRSRFLKPLQTVVGQAQRIHAVLTDLMQFARPGTPRVQLVPVGSLIQEAIERHQEMADQRRVRLVFDLPVEGWLLSADLTQVRTILSCLMRNAIEAAPPEGWAGVRVEKAENAKLRIVVEDNGPGPPPQSREHLFDPFFSGRSAGRGRGLGLSTAWRLADHNGGDVSFDDSSGLTRFVFTVPLAQTPEVEPLRNGQHSEAHARDKASSASS